MPQRSIRCRGRVFLAPSSGAAAGRAQPALGLDGRKSGPLALPFPGEDVAAILRRRVSEQRAAGRALPAVRHFFWSGAVLRPWFSRVARRESRPFRVLRPASGEKRGPVFLRPRADHSSSAESRCHLRPSRPSTSGPAGSSITRSGAPPPPSEEGGISTQRAATVSARSVEEELAARSVCGQCSSSAERLRGGAIPYTEAGSTALAKADICRPQRPCHAGCATRAGRSGPAAANPGYSCFSAYRSGPSRGAAVPQRPASASNNSPTPFQRSGKCSK